jgi:hypothetical protein
MEALNSPGFRRHCDSVKSYTEEFMKDIGRGGFDHD